MWHPQTISFDFETSGELPEYALQPWRVSSGKAWPTSLVWAYRDPTPQIKGGLWPNRGQMEQMLNYAINTNTPILGWNTAFDISWLLAYGLKDKVMQVRWLDGMLLWRHLFIEPEYENRQNRFSYGLKEGVRKFLPQHAGYEEDVDFHSTDPAELEKLHKYNVRDVVFTARISKMIWDQLDETQRNCAMVEAECLPLVAEANLNGMLVDTVTTHELRQYLTDRANDLLEELEPHGITEKVVRSPKQLSELIFDVWKLPVIKENVSKKTGKVSRSTDKEVMHELSFKDDRAAKVKQYREALNNRTKFADALLKSADYNENGRTHPSAKIFGTYSGRFTYASKQGRGKDERQTGFALHQEKRDPMYRDVLTSPPGHTLVEFDAAGQEFRWMAIASGDPTMLSLCQPGEDAHSFMGAPAGQGGEPVCCGRHTHLNGPRILQYRTCASG